MELSRISYQEKWNNSFLS